MRTPVDERFAKEIADFSLRFTCGDCLHFLRDRGTCAHEWPNEDHLLPLSPGEKEIIFCKEFELR